MDWTTDCRSSVWGRAQHKQGAVQAVGPGNRFERGGSRVVKGREEADRGGGIATGVVIKKIDSRREAAGGVRLGLRCVSLLMASLPGRVSFLLQWARVHSRLAKPEERSNRVSRWRKSGCVEEFVLTILRSGVGERVVWLGSSVVNK
jgi:hypothetical protein